MTVKNATLSPHYLAKKNPTGKIITTPKTAHLWDMTQRVVVNPCRRFGTTYRSHLQGLKILTFEDRTDRLAPKVGKEIPLHAASYPRRRQFSFTSWQKTDIWHITTLVVRLHVQKIKRKFLHGFTFFFRGTT